MHATEQQPAADYPQSDLEDALRSHGYRSVTVVDTVGSTNTWLSERVAPRAGDQGRGNGLEAVVTGFQSQGRGRLDRGWITPPGTAVTFSVACTPVDRSGRPWPQDLLPWLTLLMAHSITGAVRELTGVPAVVKWPNDVLVRDRKLCGILATMVAPTPGAAPTVVVGAGINVSQRELPVPTATSLALEVQDSDAVPSRAGLLTAVLGRFADTLDRASQDPVGQLGRGGELRSEVEAQLDTLGREVSLQLPGARDPLTATATGLGDSGQLVVRARDGREHEYSAGDVVHVRPAHGGGGPA
ncbi:MULTISPECIES: biotin--[acetyl-CoA-carboxylase] ligase [Kocuria]|uniref:biotin--[acetyl-CoA-carboxylase] ligase n=1 Tax=Kocuria TaxID=57493 RepID=UPI0008A55734|nr:MULTISPECIES: biotin--[acetyl-CoA-carboxylase] ligase [Kocuria]MCT1957989.1 biotin--[acetyl-CoA-carboxylase] ligase [Kocuria rhizophila]MCT2073196.1 biotin--[acetyl-CoA-carboxylase] ligase [Kocuria rhizophila]MDR7374978.1 BirA family biotin operon repressor/biotin-[acetyl-CoA-carboxylase] ligase [Kocuria rhizophila]OFK08683.1 biotin--[acetyl-CoA-carboxylase] ligase [Kocuria sp. HMSC066H03]PMR91007.1 biotin--[acetyl-CoA-carboxylase] ligase [Kocuria rhizophila]